MPFAGYTDFNDCVSKNNDKSDPDAYCGSIKHQVEETNKRFLSREADPNLMTPKKQMTEPVTNQSPQGEAEQEDEIKDAKREEQQGQATEQDEDEKWNFEKPKEEAEEQDEEPTGEVPEQFKEVPDKPEPEPEEQEQTQEVPEEEKVEYEGESYKLLKINESILKGNVIEYNNKFYTPLKIKERIGESDIDYEGTFYRPRTNSLIEYRGKLYQKEAENPHTDTDPPQDQAEDPANPKDQARPLELPAEEEISVSGPPAGTEPTVIEDEIRKTGENIIIKTRKGYRRLQVYEADTSTSKLENLKNRGLKKDEKESKKKA